MSIDDPPETLTAYGACFWLPMANGQFFKQWIRIRIICKSWISL